MSPTLKHLFKGNDVTIFAYGVTGSGKTHTMKGNRAAAERGIIPRLLTAIYRRGKDMEKKTNGETSVTAIMSYYEIYNDRVFDLFEAPEKRTLAGLPLREQNGKTHVVGLTEKEISTLKEFETLYDMANNHRSTSATKLNNQSSRSHAIICVRVEIKDNGTGEIKIGTVSCIDLAGSEDNRRTANDKDRMVGMFRFPSALSLSRSPILKTIESASINKSLFVLSQCVEAMSKKQNRIPYRESKMTRILSLGQNNGMTVMILNLAPTRKFHQDTLSALNFANRAKTIEVKNEPVPVQQPSRALGPISGAPVRIFGTNKASTTHNRPLSNENQPKKPLSKEKNTSQKGFSKPSQRVPLAARPLGGGGGGAQNTGAVRKAPRTSDSSNKIRRGGRELNIEDIVEKKVEEILAARALNEASSSSSSALQIPASDVNEQVNKRLEMLERKLEKKADARAEGLTYLVLAKQHVQRGEDFAALSMYRLALAYFPENEKLLKKISDLEEKRKNTMHKSSPPLPLEPAHVPKSKPKKAFAVFMDVESPKRPTKRARSLSTGSYDVEQSPRTRQLLHIINSEDVDQIMQLKVCSLHFSVGPLLTSLGRGKKAGRGFGTACSRYPRTER